MRRLNSGFVLIAAFCVSAASSAAEKGKSPAPDAQAQAKAVALVKDVHRDDYAKAKTSAQKLALAQTLLKQGQETTVAAEKYALLDEARTLAAAAGEVGEAIEATDALAAAFQVDAVALKAKLFAALPPATLSEAQSKKLLEIAPAAIDEAIAAENLEAARAMITVGSAVARKLKNISAASAMVGRSGNVEALGTALKQLQANPNDTGASGVVGLYRCLFKDDWQAGLALMEKGDAPYRELAAKERNAKSSADLLALADAWWSESERQSGGTSTRARARAGKWYRQALPELTGAVAEKAQQRFDQLGTVEQALLKKWSYGEWKDLLKLVDAKSDVSSGTWTVTKDGVAGRGGFAVFNLPYIPPAEYDLRYTFSRTEGEGGVAATIVLGGHQFKYGMGWWDKNSHAGFEWIDGLAITLGTNNVKHSLVNGQKYQVLLEVRKDGVKAYIDGKFLIECKTDGSNVHYHSTPPPKPNYRLPLGLFTKDPSVFHTFEVRDVTGEGEKLR